MLRALDNLLSNAFKYGKPPIGVCGRSHDEHLLIDVARPQGRTYRPDIARDLMRPFARGNAARVGEGTAPPPLGLAIGSIRRQPHPLPRRTEVAWNSKQNAGSFTARIRYTRSGHCLRRGYTPPFPPPPPPPYPPLPAYP